MPVSKGGSGGGAGGKDAGGVRAGNAFVEFFAKDGPLTRTLDRLKARFTAFGSFVGRVGRGAALAGAAVLTPLTALFTAGAGRAADVQRLADTFGTTTEAMSKLAYAFEAGGVQLEQFADLARDATQRNTGGLPLDQYLLAVSDALAKIPAGARRAEAAVELLGEGSRKHLALLADPGRLRGLMGRAPVIDAATGREAVRTEQELAEAAIALKMALLPLAKAVLPVVQAVAAFARENAGALQIAVAAGAGLLALGVTLQAVGLAASGVVTGFGLLAGGVKLVVTGVWAAVAAARAFLAALAAVKLASIVSAVASGIAAAAKLVWAVATGVLTGALGVLTGVVGFLLSPIGLLTAAVVAVAVAFGAAVVSAGRAKGAFSTFTADLKAGFASAAESVKTAWGGITAAIAKGDLELAGRVAVAGLKAVWAEGCLFMTKAWVDFKRSVVDGWHDITDGIAGALVEVARFGRAMSDQVKRNPALLPFVGAGPVVADALGLLPKDDRQADDWKAQLRTERDRRDKANEAFRQNQVREAEEELRKAKEDLARLANEAKAPPAGGASNSIGLPPKPAELASRVKGAFVGPLSQQLGIGDQFARKQVDLLGKIAVNTDEVKRALQKAGPLLLR